MERGVYNPSSSFANMSEKSPPPHDIGAEESVLGSILIEPVSMIKISDLLNPEDFFY